MSESFSLYYLEHQPEKLGNFKLFASCLADLFQRFSGRCLDLTQKEKTEIRNFSGTLVPIEPLLTTNSHFNLTIFSHPNFVKMFEKY